MAYQLPTFNLVCNIWHGTDPPPPAAPSVAGMQCALMAPRKNITDLALAFFIGLPGDVISMYLLVPAHSDIRDQSTASGEDIVECPAGTGRYYQLVGVDDVGKGYPNEYRFATMVKWTIIPWPTPIP